MKKIPILLLLALAFFISGISLAYNASEGSQDHTSTTQSTEKSEYGGRTREITTVSGTNYSSSASALSMGIIAAACFLCGSYLLVKHLEQGKP